MDFAPNALSAHVIPAFVPDLAKKMTQPLIKLITESRSLRVHGVRLRLSLFRLAHARRKAGRIAPSTLFISVRRSVYASDTGKSPASFVQASEARGAQRTTSKPRYYYCRPTPAVHLRCTHYYYCRSAARRGLLIKLPPAYMISLAPFPVNGFFAAAPIGAKKMTQPLPKLITESRCLRIHGVRLRLSLFHLARDRAKQDG